MSTSRCCGGFGRNHLIFVKKRLFKHEVMKLNVGDLVWYGLRGATRAHAKSFMKNGNYYVIELVIVYKQEFNRMRIYIRIHCISKIQYSWLLLWCGFAVGSKRLPCKSLPSRQVCCHARRDSDRHILVTS
jgi:hypothetical protein